MSNAVSNPHKPCQCEHCQAGEPPLNLERRMSDEAILKLIPEGYNPQIWAEVLYMVEHAIYLEKDEAAERRRNVDLGCLVAIAAYQGFLDGLHAVQRYLYGIEGFERSVYNFNLINSGDVPDPF